MNLKMPKKLKGLAKTVVDPLGIGIGDALFGKNKGPDYSAEEAAKQAAFEKGQAATDEFVAGGPAKYEKGADLAYESLSPAEKLQWQSLSPAEKQAQSGMADIKTDAKYKEHEMAALRELEDQSKSGFTARDKADMARTESEVNRANKGRLGAIQQNMQARGMSGSGMDLVAQMQSSQDANEIAAMRALEQDAMMQDRKSQATMNLGQMSSQLQSRDFGQEATKAQAQDAINRFNTQNSNDNARYNNQGQNQTAQNNWQQTNSDNRYNNQNINQTNEANWSRGNATADRNSGAQYQYNQDRLNAKLGQSTGAFNYAQDTQNMKMQRDKDAADAAGGKMGAILGTAGAVVGGIYGGPKGAAALGQLGSGLGNQVGRTQYANSYAARGGYVGDFDNMEGYDDSFDLDTQPTMLSPGEIVIPRSHAKSPVDAAKFVAKLQTNPEADSIAERNFDAPGNNPNYGRSPDFTNMDPKVLNHLAKVNPSLVEAYRKKMGTADGEVSAAKERAKWGRYADVAGNLLTDYSNSQRKDVILGNRMQDLGKKHDRVEAKQDSWKSVAPLFEKDVAEAENDRTRAERMFDKETSLGVMDKANAKEAKSNDPSSAESAAAREFLKKISPQAASMAGFNNLSEAQINKMAPELYKSYNDQANRDSQAEYRAAMRDQTSALRSRAMDDKNAERADKQVEKMEQLRVGDLGFAQTADDAKQLKAGIENKASFDSRLDELIALRVKHSGGAILNREDVGRAKQLSKDLLLQYKDMAKLGVLSQSDEKILNTIIPDDPLQYNSIAAGIQGQDPTLHKLQKFKADANKDFETKVGNRLRNEGRKEQPAVAAAPKTNEVKRKTPDGQTAIFNADTKEFIRYEK